MKSSIFSQSSFDTFIRLILNAKSDEDSMRISSKLQDWLKWLLDKGDITNEQFTRFSHELDQSIKQRITSPKNFWHIHRTLFTITIVLILMFVGTYVMYVNNISLFSTTEKYGRNKTRVKTLPYQGRLIDKNGQPVTSKKDIYFKLYSSENDTNVLYTGSCVGASGITPDYKGDFTVVLGADCNMSPIDDSLFSTYNALFVGVQIGSESELKPRQKVITAGYSDDAARLSGMELGTDKLNVPYIDKNAIVKIDAKDPVIKSTNGSFSIESESLTFKTTALENGSIIFQPHVKGNTIVGTGNFGIGTFTPEHLLSLEGVEPYNSVGSVVNLATVDDPALSALDLEVGTPVDGVESSFVRFFGNSQKNQKGSLVGSIRLNNEGVAYETSGADFAEYFDSEEPYIAPGYIISLSSRGVRKARRDEHVVGVVSGNAGFVGNRKSSGNQLLVALVGQVYVYINKSSEPISKGDPIRVSSVPGIGEKGNDDNIVGFSLEDAVNFPIVECPGENNLESKMACLRIKILLK